MTRFTSFSNRNAKVLNRIALVQFKSFMTKIESQKKRFK